MYVLYIEQNYIPTLTALLGIYLYLKSKNNDDSVKHVKLFLNLLFIYFSLCTFAKFLMSFLKAQVQSDINPLYFFSPNVIYLGQRSQLKSIFLDFLSARVKIR